jgi:hypothetical protein
MLRVLQDFRFLFPRLWWLVLSAMWGSNLGVEVQGSFKMSGAALVAIAASIGNLLQGWDNATIAGKSSALYPDFGLFTGDMKFGF